MVDMGLLVDITSYYVHMHAGGVNPVSTSRSNVRSMEAASGAGMEPTKKPSVQPTSSRQRVGDSVVVGMDGSQGKVLAVDKGTAVSWLLLRRRRLHAWIHASFQNMNGADAAWMLHRCCMDAACGLVRPDSLQLLLSLMQSVV